MDGQAHDAGWLLTNFHSHKLKESSTHPWESGSIFFACALTVGLQALPAAGQGCGV